MCGIVGYVGHQDAVPILLDGLSKLEYRGYDSAGVAVQRGEKIEIRRSVGKLVNLQKSLAQKQIAGTCGIGHTRWATHGKPSEQNAHPHRSESCVLVHNGIIENYVELKQRLLKDGYKFQSETDTEVVAHLIDKHLQKAGLHLADAVRAAAKEIRGSYAITVISEREPGMLVAARSGCPLVIGRSTDASFVGSDVMAMLAHTRDVTFLEEGDVAEVTASNVTYTDLDGHPVTRKNSMVTWDASAAEKSGYPHFMLKEIHEQPQTILDTIRGRYSYESGEADLPDIGLTPKQFAEVGRIWIVACGTSWHAGLVGKYLLEEMVRTPVQVDIGSEFRYRDPLIEKNDLFITISQSGETADTLAAAREAKQKGARVVSIVNVVGSTLARESDGVLYTHCGPEIGVASTKAFTSQLAALYMLALHLGRVRGVLSAADGKAWLDRLVTLPALVKHVLGREAEILAIAKRYYKKPDFLYLARGINYPIALEGALKLKEISYIHAEGYAAGEMKHGPIALIDKDMPVVVLAPRDRLYEKTVSNLMEVKARRAPVIAFVAEGERELGKTADAVFTIPDVHPLLSPILFTIPLQLLAYHIAVLRGEDVDQPRNLAKSVTVE
ncbi:MAG: Glutamine--fructose-6-phosphate aminotransferase [isomerizing] [Nitrospirae bacterium]|nr:Glutamine--fructose-6-phosphate aminotransferase [isomerizing] [Nitrospirota bacterium]MCE7966790.1 glutamine--fructose-6-phosphate transaminase (isomerizing) [Nitrospira sp. NTP2]MCK6494014.1 glutamine--fructose-6-phosphate transaminase (isomerizing) [Nitrospira sp.]MEB2339969.1 glutamine--fructose-6-phosphate transaminase (isomerizing) [Nitrospirales bacterium]QOJ36744.1 MAG: glutamine--fructose-6-phosphate transaminase (isomerizing) [Nitrospira sp.]